MFLWDEGFKNDTLYKEIKISKSMVIHQLSSCCHRRLCYPLSFCFVRGTGVKDGDVQAR